MSRIRKTKTVTLNIDGKICQGTSDQTILDIARANEIYIPTMCYLTKVMPIASCRMCVVDVEGVDGMILSCQEKAVDGAVIHTNSNELYNERQSIMRLYGVNHPLECGVCDKSGECDLQNKTLEFDIAEQPYGAKDQHRPVQNWGFVSYDPALCIMCEKCVRVSNEIVGNQALEIKAGGYRSTIVNTKMNLNDMSLGESAAVCPVGALVSTDFKYSSNAWELEKIPATCAYCSAGCKIYYEVKNDTVYRVTNEYEYASICGRARFDFDFANKNVTKNTELFEEAVEAFKQADSVIFDSRITNEEALILQDLKEKYGFRLINHEARAYQKFMKAYSSVSGNILYPGTLADVADADSIVVLGTKISDDNEQVKYHINMASKRNQARVTYMHPLEEISMQNIITQFVKYEVGTEDGVVALLADTLLQNIEIADDVKSFLDDLDIGNLSAESNVGEEELEELAKVLERTRRRVMVVGQDLYAHHKAENIAKLIALIEKYANFSILIVPPATNALGVALICELDDEVVGKSVGYNARADFMLGRCGKGDLDMPALNQQEGTLTTIDKKVVPTNAAISYGGYVLNDIANALGLLSKYTVDYTQKLPQDKGYKAVEFDSLPDEYDNLGNEHRGYTLNTFHIDPEGTLDEIDELDGYDGVVIYNCDTQSAIADKLRNGKEESHPALVGSKQFAMASKIDDNEVIKFTVDDVEFVRVFKIDPDMKGTIAINPLYDIGFDRALLSSYRFNRLKFQRVES